LFTTKSKEVYISLGLLRIHLARCAVSRARAPNSSASATLTTGYSPSVAEKRIFRASSVRAVHGEVHTTYGSHF
jgi:hypothetical protein